MRLRQDRKGELTAAGRTNATVGFRGRNFEMAEPPQFAIILTN